MKIYLALSYNLEKFRPLIASVIVAKGHEISMPESTGDPDDDLELLKVYAIKNANLVFIDISGNYKNYSDSSVYHEAKHVTKAPVVYLDDKNNPKPDFAEHDLIVYFDLENSEQSIVDDIGNFLNNLGIADFNLIETL